MSEEQYDFVNRCLKAEELVKSLMISESSDRVWCAVFCGLLVELTFNQPDQDSAFAEVLSSTCRQYRKLKEAMK